jgi:hypothetical protein
MREVYSLIWLALVGAFRSRASLEAENTILRHQLNVLRRQSPKRTHLSLEKDAPVSRAVDRAGHILCRSILGGLHHQHGRI